MSTAGWTTTVLWSPFTQLSRVRDVLEKIGKRPRGSNVLPMSLPHLPQLMDDRHDINVGFATSRLLFLPHNYCALLLTSVLLLTTCIATEISILFYAAQ